MTFEVWQSDRSHGGRSRPQCGSFPKDRTGCATRHEPIENWLYRINVTEGVLDETSIIEDTCGGISPLENLRLLAT